MNKHYKLFLLEEFWKVFIRNWYFDVLFLKSKSKPFQFSVQRLCFYTKYRPKIESTVKKKKKIWKTTKCAAINFSGKCPDECSEETHVSSNNSRTLNLTLTLILTLYAEKVSGGCFLTPRKYIMNKQHMSIKSMNTCNSAEVN